MRTAVFTIAANDNLSGASVLLDSVGRHLPDADRYLVLADKRLDGVAYPPGATLMGADELGIPDFPCFAFRYDPDEFRAALKPFAFLRLLHDLSYQACLYFSPQTELFSPLPAVTGALDSGASILLTPHLLHPAEQEDAPDDLTFLRLGAYNLDFMAAAATVEAVELLGWWAGWLRWDCVDDPGLGLNMDQTFANLLPGFGDGVHVLRDPELNVAAWNAAGRGFTVSGTGEARVGGKALGFFNFSGHDPAGPDTLRSQAGLYRGTGEDSPAFQGFLAGYAGRLRAAGAGDVPRACYGYGRFASGTPIPRVARRMFRDDCPAWAGDPFQSFEQWIHQPLPGAVAGVGSAVPSVMLGWIQARTPELKDCVPSTPGGAEQITRWWLRPGAVPGVDRRFFEAQSLAAGLKPMRPDAACPLPSPDRADASVLTDAAEGIAAHIPRSLAAGLEYFTGRMERLGSDSADATGRVLVASAAGRAAPLLQPACRDAYRIVVPASETLPSPEEFRSAAAQADEIWAPTRFIQAAAVLAVECPVIHMPLAETLLTRPLPAPSADRELAPYILVDGGDLATATAAVDCCRTALADLPPAFRPAIVVRSSASAHQALAGSDVRLLGPDGGEEEWASSVAGAVCLVSLHGGAALALAIVRAMACGVPVVATDYGGCTDVLTPATGFPVGFSCIAGTSSVEADRDHAAWSIRWLLQNLDEGRQRARTARLTLERLQHPTIVAGLQATRLRLLGLP